MSIFAARCGVRKPKAARKRPVQFANAELATWEGDERGTSGFIATLPVWVVSEANQRECWQVKNKRRAQQVNAVRLAVDRYAFALRARGFNRWSVQLTRMGPRKLDGDNLQRAFKAVRDAVAASVGLDDGDARYAWTYEQQTGQAYGIRIRLEAARGD